jgi:hypothetical protein
MSKNNFCHSNYLFKCDLLNKYILKNTFSYPKVDSVCLNVSLENLLIDQTNHTELYSKVRTFFLFFLFTLNLPFLKYSNFVKYNKINYSSNVVDFKIYLNISRKKAINTFLISLFVENVDTFKLDHNLLLIKSTFLTPLNIIKMRLLLPLICLQDFSYLMSSNLFSMNVKDILIFMDLTLKNKNNKKSNKKNIFNFFKNLPYFWLF